jgi:site-specific DNA-methyltransferase (adenine-specific)
MSGLEDAGFEIRDCISWIFGSGFPKSHNAGNGWGTALKPACEPIVLARKPISEHTVAANVLRWGTGGIYIDGCQA